ncbi:hypothetical protein [Winogradskyella sp.]|uniref:hypothetical protein n=1 Tax=Winogradskyella sp. TaxID=1883156 RepID=UPI0026304609|nr:hypothetical protein [Winogradskyella sp.]
MKKITTLSLVFLLTTLFINAQTTFTVDNTEGADADYNDLQSAINSVLANSILYVHASEINYGDITIDKPISLIGFSHSAEDKETMIDEVDLLDSASNVRLSGIHFTNDLTVNNDNSIVSDLIIENNFFDSFAEVFFTGDELVVNMTMRGNILNTVGSDFQSSTNYSNSIIANNIFYDDLHVFFHESVAVENNIFLNGATVENSDDETGNLVVQDCIFYDNRSSNFDPNRVGVVFQNCLSYNETNSVTTLIGTGNFNDIDPQFVSADDDIFDPTIDDYNLQPGSDALGNGVAGDDIGLYSTNTNFTFNNFGYTAGIPIVTITAITSQIAPGGDLEVTIESNSN